MENNVKTIGQNARRRQTLGNISLGATIGRHAETEREVFQFNEDRFRHTVVIGRTGSGKSNHIQRMEREDIMSGAGMIILASHEEDALYPLSCVPDERLGDVVFADFGNPYHLPVMNPLDVDVEDPKAVARAVNACLELLKIDTHYDWAGPRFNQMARMCLELILQPGYPHVRHLGAIETLMSDDDCRKAALAKCGDQRLKDLWHQDLEARNSRDYGEVTQWFTSKVSRFSGDPVLRHVLSAGRTTIDIADIVAEGKVFIASIPETVIGETAARMLGKWIMMQLRDAIKQRNARPQAEQRKDYNAFCTGGRSHATTSEPDPFFVYVDEFAKFADPGFAELLAESRKFNVGVTLSFQTMSQTRVMDFWTEQVGGLEQAILGNVGSIVCYPLGIADAELMAAQFDVDAEKLKRIERYRPLARLCIDNRICAPGTLEVDRRPDPDNPTAPNRIADMHIERGVWTPADEGPEEAAERERALHEAQDKLWWDLLWKIPDELTGQTLEKSLGFAPSIQIQPGSAGKPAASAEPSLPHDASDETLVKLIKDGQASGTVPSDIAGWELHAQRKLMSNAGHKAVERLKLRYSPAIDHLSSEYGKCLPAPMRGVLKPRLEREFVKAVLEFEPRIPSNTLAVHADLSMRASAAGLVAEFLKESCSGCERAEQLADTIGAAMRLSVAHAHSYGWHPLLEGRTPYKPDAARAWKVAVNPSWLRTIVCRALQYADSGPELFELDSAA